MAARGIIVDIPKGFYDEVRPFLKPGDTKDNVYAGLVGWGYQSYKDKGGFGNLSLESKMRCETRTLLIPDEVVLAISQIEGFKENSQTAYVKLIKLGIDSYKEAIEEDKKEEK